MVDSFNQEEGSSLHLFFSSHLFISSFHLFVCISLQVFKFTQLAKRRDKISNCTRKLILNNMSLAGSVSQKWRSVFAAKRGIIVGDILKHYRIDHKQQQPPTETQKVVHEFYFRDDVSRVLPYKKLTRRVKDHNGMYQRVAVRVMEVTLREGLKTFKNLHPEIKICRATFESLRPKNIRLSRCAQRLQCGCTYHQNMDYVRKACHHLLLMNGKESTLADNESLINATLCDSKSLKYILGRCNECKKFPNIDDLGLENLKCSKDCIKKRERLQRSHNKSAPV